MKWNEFSKLATSDELSTYFSEERKHEYFCHYTSLGNIDCILSNFQLWLNSFENCNDVLDEKQFEMNTDGKKVNYKKHYTICFSTGVNENLPLWYLYSGLDGKGGRLRFTDNLVKKACRLGKFELWEFDENCKPVKLVERLEHGKNATFAFKDVLYNRIDSSSKVSLKYNTMTNYLIPKNEFDKFEKTYQGFLKGLIWYYEKETRIVVEICDDLFKKIQDDGKKYKVIWDFSDMHIKDKDKINASRYLKVDLGPAIEDVQEILEKYSNIRQFYKSKSNVELSMYHGTVNFELHCNCKTHTNI